jgi:23S rRNA (guanine2445-N2)-methyltransferase
VSEHQPEHLFAACAPGLEEVLEGELRGLGLAARAVPGGAEASGASALALACLGSRVADAVALRLFDGPERELAGALSAARRRFGPSAPFAVRRRAGRASLSLDAAGAPLFKRGWRARVGAAPLRESLAAGILLAAGYDGRAPFLDPMCGSGTLALEAAALAARRAPGLGRTFAFERWPGHDRAATEAVRARLAALARDAPAAIHASDRNAGALRLAQKNAAAAGFAGVIRFSRSDAAVAELPREPGLVAVNPPYGLRLAEEVEAAWRALAALLRRAAGWRIAVLAPDRPFERLLPGSPARELRVRNGGLACRLLVYEPAGREAARPGGA